MSTLYLDTETYNGVKDISAGTYEYARTAEVLIITYALDGNPVQLWDCTQNNTMPKNLWEWLHDPDIGLTAHNALFDRTVLRLALNIPTPINRWRCTQAKALSHGFPGSLDKLGSILGLSQDQAKLKDGKKLIHRFCKPAPKNHKADRYTQDSHPQEWARFCEYAVRDVAAMRDIDHRLPPWNYGPDEQKIYHLDQRVNDRGFRVDQDLVKAGVRASTTEKQSLKARFKVLTKGIVSSPTQREKFKNFLNMRFDLGLENTQSQTFKSLLGDPDQEIPDMARELMDISIKSNKTSTAKYAALEPAISPDGHFRGGLQYAGAARTRRWSGRTFQPHNLPSRGLPEPQAIECYIQALKINLHETLFDDHMLYASAALRGVLLPKADHKLVVADLSNIEGRINAWLAGETWKLKAFKHFDEGKGPDLYKVTAAHILGITPNDVSQVQRNVMGKIPELALGYQGGVGAFQTFSKAYGVTMADHWETIQDALPNSAIQNAHTNYKHWGYKNEDISQTEWLACETVKLSWRARHPAIVSLWKTCNQAAKSALTRPGNVFTAGPHLKFKTLTYAGKPYLLVRLPSSRVLCYFDPRIDDKGQLSYMGVNTFTRQWERVFTYGGKLVENACQSLSRDILADSMTLVEEEGFEILLTVHDEIVTQAPCEDTFSPDKLASYMAKQPPWANRLPLAAQGFQAERYTKGA